MENMLSRNSFPQICVVSVIEFVGDRGIQQEYVGSGSLSNQSIYFLVNPVALPAHGPIKLRSTISPLIYQLGIQLQRGVARSMVKNAKFSFGLFNLQKN